MLRELEAKLLERLAPRRGNGGGGGGGGSAGAVGRWDDDPMPLRGGQGTLHFYTFRTSVLEQAPTAALVPAAPGSSMCVSGGGAYKLAAQIKAVFAVERVAPVDELDALIRGLGFVVKRSAREDESFSCTNVRFAGMVGSERERLVTRPEPLSAFILVNVGSGVSFVDCDLAANTYRRVGGSSLGGGTFHGLATLLTGDNDFDSAMNAAASGDSTAVDLLVGDIYGARGAESLGLRASILASSFARVATDPAASRTVTKGDKILAVLMMIGINLTAMACLHARLCGRTTIFFSGNFLGTPQPSQRRPENLAIRVFAYGVDFWSGGAMRAVFLRTQGDLGSVGALLAGGASSASARL